MVCTKEGAYRDDITAFAFKRVVEVICRQPTEPFRPILLTQPWSGEA